ncbi:hypothetical protein NW768_010412 [Fusarium equiseti]|uniref:Uncharacterized protein n=1 Tax=Fusarium equiseti TaxID=61235 RepID=A0ABQ8R0T7_FUSEQ|nr:hypothetical protein NW768_010412 [Fusarium equiseti]
MHNHDPTEDLGLICPSGTNFYVCKDDPERFIGCCAINPCGTRKGLCPDQHLKAASFDKAYEEYISPQACINDNVDVAWHACSWSTSSFVGCCAVDPCSGGCPVKQLRAAKLSDNARDAECFLGEDYEYEPKPSYTSSSSMDSTTSTSACSTTTSSTTTSSTTTSSTTTSSTTTSSTTTSSTTTSSTTIVSSIASSFTTSIVTTSASSTTLASSPKPTSAPLKEGDGPNLKLLWLLLIIGVIIVLAIIYAAYKWRSKRREAEINEASSLDNDADKRTTEPINNYSICPPSQFAGLPPPSVTEKKAPTTRRDLQTEDGQIAVKSEISQTHSAELTRSQINLSINLSSPSPGSSRASQQDSPFPPPQCEPSQQRGDNDPVEARHDSDANTPANPQLDDHQSVELEASPISRKQFPKPPAELDDTSTRIRLSELPNSRQRATSQPSLGREALAVPKNTLSEAGRRESVTHPDSTTRHVETKDGRVVNDKNTPQTNPTVSMRDSRPRLPRQDLPYPARNDAKTEEGRVVNETDIQRTHSAEPTQSQTGPPTNMSPDHSLPIRRGLPCPPELRPTNQKEFPQPDSLFKRHDFGPLLLTQDTALPSRPSQQPLNNDSGGAHRLSRGNVPVSINPQFGDPDTEDRGRCSSQLDWTGIRSGRLEVANPDPREESPERSTVSKIIRVPGRGRTQKRQRPQIPRKPLPTLSEESLD